MTNDPYLDQGTCGCIFRMARKNLWRVAGYDLEDLVQEGYYCYYKCRMKYVGRPPGLRRDGTKRRPLPFTNPDKIARKHFMRLVQMAFRNHINTLAARHPVKVDGVLVEVPISSLVRDAQTEEQLWDQLMPPEYEVATAGELVRSAPREIKQLFQLLLNDALELSGCRRLIGNGEWFVENAPRRIGHHRETNNERFCRLLGLPRGTDIVGQVERYFLG